MNYTDPESLYHEAQDKQRVVITGTQASMITAMIAHTLTTHDRKFDLVRNGEYNGDQSIKESDAPLLIIEETRKPYAELISYHHHIGIISDIDNTPEILRNITRFAEASPKAGILIYSDRAPVPGIAKVPRADVTLIPYSLYAYKDEKGKLFLITSTGERFPIQISGEDNLRSLSAAKELLKKTGISSGQFYKAMTTFIQS